MTNLIQPQTSGAGKLTSRLLCLVLVSFSIFMASAFGQQQQPEAPLTNLSIIRLVKAGFKEKTIIAIINSRPNHFKMDTEQLIQLKHSGVSENIILAMMSLDGDFSSSDEDWANDSFMRGSTGNSGGSQGNGVDIFGSNSGSKSQTKTRGTRGGNDKEGNITGSATVRIIKPPAEAGGTALKLERTPTLTNDAVIRLVDAGFSEGTIIKRIEDSPAEFDLSPAKLDELHKRRVTDPIIAAMTAAMDGKDGEAKPNERE